MRDYCSGAYTPYSDATFVERFGHWSAASAPPYSIAVGILHLDPMWRSAGAVNRSAQLADNALKPQLAGVPEDILGVALDVLVVSDAGSGTGQDRFQGGLANFQWIAPQVIDTKLKEVKGVEEDRFVVVLYRMKSKFDRPSAPQATASPSISRTYT